MSADFLGLLTTAAVETWHMTVLAAPFLLLGLAIAGFVHLLMPTEQVQRYLGKPGLRGAALAAAIGVPLPVCSCGVLPIAVEMKRKRASDAASLSFLTTTPETGVDSVLFTWALMGPVMAIARPISAFATAMLGAVWVGAGQQEAAAETVAPAPAAPATPSCCCQPAAAPAVTAAAATTATAERRGVVRTVREAVRYGFVELFDEIAFWLVLGLALGGVLTAVLPDDLAALGLGRGLLPMLVMLGVGVPLYICASASTPVAAALLAKGLAPGAALVFLLAGPATNAASLVVLLRTFGARFVRIYVASVALGSLACGLLLDALLAATGWTITLPAVAAHEHAGNPLALAAAGLLIVLLLASTLRGSLRNGFAELWQGIQGLRRLAGSTS